MKLELDIFDENELVRACELVGYKNKKNYLIDLKKKILEKMILEKINPNNIELKDQYINALKEFKVDFNENDLDRDLQKKLYQFSKDLLIKALEKMSKRKKKKLTDQIEQELDSDTIDALKKTGKKGLKAGASVLLLQGGAIAITGSNLGICLLLTQGLSALSGILGVTFPFAAYTGAAVLGGNILAVATFLSSPWVWGPVLGITSFKFYKSYKKKPYINLAGINYLIETKKLMNKYG